MIELADMKLFVQAVQGGSLSAAGRTLGFSPAVGSKRLSRLESQLGTRLLQRSSRKLTLTDEGGRYFERCLAILAEIEDAEAELGHAQTLVRGVLRVSSPVALGRRWIGPALARLAEQHRELQIQLSLSDSVVDLIEGGYDCVIRIGMQEDSRLLARKLAENRRVICASPDYLRRMGTPLRPDQLAQHECILMQASSAMHADWRLQHGAHSETIRVHGRWLTNNGEQAHDWAIAGLGLVRRSIWDVAPALAAGDLVEVLSDWRSDSAPIQLLYASRRFLPARTRVLIDFLVQHFASAAPGLM